MTKPISALIVDDEQPSRENLRLALRDHPDWHIADLCASVDQARMALRQNVGIDVVFLDVQMPDESGIVLARELSALYAPPVVVFVTAYQHYAVQAFEFHAIDYLLKPFDDERLALALDRVRELLDLRRRGDFYGEALRRYLADSSQPVADAQRPFVDRLCVRSVGHIAMIEVAELDWMLSSGNYVELHVGDRMVLHRSTLAQLDERLDPTQFLRVHRRAIVRRSLCRSLRVIGDGSYQLTLDNGASVPVSERYVAAVRAQLGA